MDNQSLKSEESYSDLLCFLRKLMKYYRDNNFKACALSHVPVDLINTNVNTRIQSLFLKSCHPYLIELIYLKELVSWFKNCFFTWMDVPNCPKCLLKMSIVGNVTSKRNELFSKSVEIYKCPLCGTADFFNRYVDPRVLLITREGRCSEFALCFTLICLSLGMRARYVVDLTDHCWTEVYSPYRHHWIHIDPSEGIVNQPLLYELGWKKELTYVFSVGETDIQDVTWRYSSNHNSILSRRDMRMNNYINELCFNRNLLLKELSPKVAEKELLLVIEELANLLIQQKPTGSYGARTSGV